MKIGINLKIDVTKIDKARLFAGTKGTYLDAIVFVNSGEADKYGNNGMIAQDVTKDEKASGVKGPILGNCKIFWTDGATQETPTDNSGFGGPNQGPAL